MKKLTTKVITCLCALTLSATCVTFASAVESKPKQTIEITQAKTNHKKVSITVKKAKLQGKRPHIKIKIENTSGKYMNYGRPYSVYRKTKNGLVDCSIGDKFWTCDMIMVSGKKHTRDFSLKGYDTSKKGTYILSFGFYITNDWEGHTKHCTAKVKFKTNGKTTA